MRNRQAFTLIELLVVIAIISILAAILFPVFAKVREKARQTSCASNMRQLSLAFIQYTEDYDEVLPGAGDLGFQASEGGWVNIVHYAPSTFNVAGGAIYSYVKNPQIYVCPSDSIGQKTGLSYGMNSCLVHNGGTLIGAVHFGQPLAAVDSPTSMMLLGEESSGSAPDGAVVTGDGGTDDGFIWYTNGAADADTIRHTGFGNITFLDGHVKAVSPNQIAAQHLRTGGEYSLNCPYQ